MPRTSKKGDQITWYIPKSLGPYVKAVQRKEGLSRNETISHLVDLGLKIYRFKDKIFDRALKNNSSIDSVLEAKLGDLDT